MPGQRSPCWTSRERTSVSDFLYPFLDGVGPDVPALLDDLVAIRAALGRPAAGTRAIAGSAPTVAPATMPGNLPGGLSS